LEPQNIEEALQDTYYNPEFPGSFCGNEPLVRNVHKRLKGFHSLKYIRQRTRDWLKSQDTYTLHTPIRRHFKRNPIIVYGIDDQWQADLVDMHHWQSENHGYAHLLTCIDIFSKYAWVRPILSKSSDHMCDAFKEIFEQNGRIPNQLQTDKGKEFLNKAVQTLFKKYGIKHFTTENETKASVIERFNRTLKARMWRYFTENGNHHYMDALKHIVSGYNNTEHRTLGISPSSVTLDKERYLWDKMFGKNKAKNNAIRCKYPVGTQVRLSKLKQQFDKGYLPNWTDEIFVITNIIPRYPRVVYKVVDSRGEEVLGTFYEDELQSVQKDLEHDEFEIERILDQRIVDSDGSREALVKWKGWPDKFNSWVKLN
jgi:transposase InsO family protein